MKAKKLLVCLIILAVWVLVPLYAIADLIRRAPQPIDTSKTAVAKQQIDTSKIAIAKLASTRPTPELRKITRSSRLRGDGLTTAKWQVMRPVVATAIKRSVQTMPTTVNFAQNLSATGNKITITPRSFPPDTSLWFRGYMEFTLVYDYAVVFAQQGTSITLQFPIVANAIYLASCTGVFETDFEFRANITAPTGPYTVTYSGHAMPYTDSSTQMTWIVPGNLASSYAYLKLTPSGLAPLGSNAITEAFLGCDIMRVQ
jgi:hypothetical protein